MVVGGGDVGDEALADADEQTPDGRPADGPQTTDEGRGQCRDHPGHRIATEESTGERADDDPRRRPEHAGHDPAVRRDAPGRDAEQGGALLVARHGAQGQAGAGAAHDHPEHDREQHGHAGGVQGIGGQGPPRPGEVGEQAVRQHRFEHTPSLAEAVGQGDRALQVEQHADHRGGLGRRSSMAQRPRHDQVHDEADERRHGQRAGERRPERQPAVRQAQPDRDVEGTGQHVEQREDQVACPAQLDELVGGRHRHRPRAQG